MPVKPVESFELVFTNLGGAPKEMTFQVKEEKRSRSLQHTYEIVYTVLINPHNDTDMGSYLGYTDTASDEVIIAWNVWEHASDTFFNGYMVKKWPPVCTRLDANQYEVIIKYAPLFISNFQISPLRTKKFQDIKTEVHELTSTGYSQVNPVDMVGDEETAHTFINVDKEGEVHGVDILDPIFNWTERWAWGPQDEMWVVEGVDDDAVRVDYFDVLTKLSCTVNSTSFRGFQRGEVLFRSASGRFINPLLWEIDYSFSARPNKSSLDLGGKEVNLGNRWSTHGWNIVDLELVAEKEIIFGNVKVVAPIPRFAKIHQVYKLQNFSVLNTYPKIKLSEGRQYAATEELDENGEIKIAAKIPTLGGWTAAPILGTYQEIS